ncbi:hypothetical protein OKW45_004247 [Paraburkholderia sp. WSM4175]
MHIPRRSRALVGRKLMERRYLPLLFLVIAAPSWAGGTVAGAQVVISLGYGSRDLTLLHQLEDELDVAARAANCGELDGDEIAPDGRSASIYMTSGDGDRLVRAIRPILKAHGFSQDAHINTGG